MGPLDQDKGHVGGSALEPAPDDCVDSDARTLVLDKRQVDGRLRNCNNIPRAVVLTCPHFTPDPNTLRPAWTNLYQQLRSRVDLVQTLLRQHDAHFMYILKAAQTRWLDRCTIYTPFRRPYTMVKLFFLPAEPINCEFQVRGEPTRGVLEGTEVVSNKPMMRIHLSYPSRPRIDFLRQLKNALYCGAARRLTPNQARSVWDLAFPHPRVGRGYEYVSRLIRFNPAPSKRRRSPWPFYGSYDSLDPAKTTPHLATIHFMTTHARRDRSVNRIRLHDSKILGQF